MPVRVECPHCHKSLGVPRRKRGSSIACPRCGANFVVPQDADEEAPASGPLDVGPALSAPLAASAAGSSKVARFVATEKTAAPSAVQPNGQLPDLALAERVARKPEQSSSSGNPALLVVALCLSFGMSLLLLVADLSPRAGESRRKLDARQEIQEKFIRNAHNPRDTWQALLRRAQQAYARGDRAEEARLYREVLKLLHSEHVDRFTGVTGSPASDRELRRLIGEILR
jgi:predicted lipid-binding transport protein (Tim44 family)